MGELGPTWSLNFSMCGRAGSHSILPNLGYGNFEEENLLFAVIYN